MDKNDEYRKYAREAQNLADRSRNPGDKASWLRIAQSWLNMLPKPERTPTERFDDQVRDEGTNQDISKREQ
jgi:hypothetical protein